MFNTITRHMVKMFKIGESNSKSNQDRINKAVTLKDTNPPPLSILWKTHKEHQGLPPTKPLCDARNGPLARTSGLLSMVFRPILESIELPEDCDSTEDMLWVVQQANNKLAAAPPQHGDLAIFSMDAEALYPSLHIEDILEGIMDTVTSDSPH